MAYGFGIIGCGMISHFHAKAIEAVRGARFTGCFSSRFEAAEKLSEQFGGVAYHDLDSMLADPAVNIVNICTPSGAHLETAVAAANAGKHVIVEKPLEITLKRCDKIIQACQKNDVVLSTILPSRFHAASQTLKKAIEAGKFGTLTLGDSYVKWFRTQEYYDQGQWRGTWALTGEAR